MRLVYVSEKSANVLICNIKSKIVSWQELDRVGYCLISAGTFLGTVHATFKDYKIKLLYRNWLHFRGQVTAVDLPRSNGPVFGRYQLKK